MVVLQLLQYHAILVMGIFITIENIKIINRQTHAVDQLDVDALFTVLWWRYNQPDKKLHHRLLRQLHWTCSRDDSLQHAALP